MVAETMTTNFRALLFSVTPCMFCVSVYCDNFLILHKNSKFAVLCQLFRSMFYEYWVELQIQTHKHYGTSNFSSQTIVSHSCNICNSYDALELLVCLLRTNCEST